MKKLNQIAVLFAAATIAGTAFADITGANWRNGDGQLVWKNGDQTLCWQTPHWTPATAASQECGMPPRVKKPKKIIRKKAKKVLPPSPPTATLLPHPHQSRL